MTQADAKEKDAASRALSPAAQRALATWRRYTMSGGAGPVVPLSTAYTPAHAVPRRLR